jgi:hypothetical protein
MIASVNEPAGGPPPPMHGPERKFPPIPLMAVGTLVFVVVGGIYLAAYLPRRAPMGPALGLVLAADVLLVVNVVVLSRVRDFAWSRFFQVAGWALVAYCVIAGMLEYVFVLDGTRGGMLALLSLMLFTFGVDVPLNLGFSVARYEDPAPLASTALVR